MKKNFLIVFIVLFSISCQKEISHEVESNQVDIYVAGLEEKGSGYVAKYWKNGQPIELTDGTTNAAATSIFVSGNDVYVCGSVDAIATYWKNGNPVTLGDGNATSIAVSGNDVYVAGWIRIFAGVVSIRACYWKNGDITYLPENTRPADYWSSYPITSIGTWANSIFISGADIYIAGGETVDRMTSPYPNLSGIGCRSAVYWKNGNEIYLIKGSYGGSYADEANSIFVAGQDVYACGALEARYWKNESSVYLPGRTAKSIFVSEGDVYVAGSQPDGQPFQTYFGVFYRDVAKYWKNGNPVNLSDGTKNAYPTSIAVSGDDVYAAGYEEMTAGDRDFIAKYWKNGNPVILGDGSKYSEASSIFLAKK
jgi:hypothetical protein